MSTLESGAALEPSASDDLSALSPSGSGLVLAGLAVARPWTLTQRPRPEIEGCPRRAPVRVRVVRRLMARGMISRSTAASGMQVASAAGQFAIAGHALELRLRLRLRCEYLCSSSAMGVI
jgi:hypothetical protein